MFLIEFFWTTSARSCTVCLEGEELLRLEQRIVSKRYAVGYPAVDVTAKADLSIALFACRQPVRCGSDVRSRVFHSGNH